MRARAREEKQACALGYSTVFGAGSLVAAALAVLLQVREGEGGLYWIERRDEGVREREAKQARALWYGIPFGAGSLVAVALAVLLQVKRWGKRVEGGCRGVGMMSRIGGRG